jgi:iron complex outermembrane recepter protein
MPRVRCALLASMAICAMLTLAGPAVGAQAQQTQIHFTIPAQPLPQALLTFAQQTHLSIVAPDELTAGLRSAAVSGVFTEKEGLRRLLSGSGLRFEFIDASSVRIYFEGKPASPKKATAEERKPAAAAEAAEIQEVMVTAQKREQRLNDVPIPVTVLDTNKMTDSGQFLLKDYYNTIPGFAVTPSYEQNQSLTIRGITTGNSPIPTVGFLVDDVPFGSPIAQSSSLPDIDPGDLERIEVLRGPQGTLYGASSMGGLVKFVTRAPSTDAFSGRIEAGTEFARNGAEPGYQLRGSLNIPLTDTLAIRVSGFDRQEAGYIDDPTLNEKGVNEFHSSGGHFAALWKATDHFSVNFSALYQDDRGDGVNDVTVAPGVGDLQQKFIPNTGTSDRVTQAYSVTMKADFGDVHVQSLTGYNSSHYSDIFDMSNNFGSYMNKTFGVSGAPYADDFRPSNLTEELRANGTIGDKFEWLVGGFVADDQNHLRQTAYAANPTTGQIVGVGDDGFYHYKYNEDAVFTDLTYHATDKFSVQIGGRYSEIENRTGPYSVVEPIFTGNTTPVIQSVLHAKFHPFTHLFTPQYQLSKDVMVYARLASGFRSGGGNLLFPGVPATFNPDTTENYELGLKGDFFNHALSVDASVYHIDWNNIQIQERTSTNHGYIGNGGRAKSEGIELSVEAHPWTGATISAWGDYDDAVLTEKFPTGATIYGAVGNRLPISPTYSGNFSARQEFPLSNGITGFAGGTITYVGDRLGVFLAHGLTRQDFPAYTEVDLNFGATTKGWTVNIYANNLTDERGVLQGGAGYSNPTTFYYIRPRTVGLSVSKTF